jgi:hypothetical protein
MNLSFLYTIGGFAVLVFGIWLIVKQMKTFAKKEQDQLGFDIKLLGGGIMAIILGISLIANYI